MTSKTFPSSINTVGLPVMDNRKEIEQSGIYYPDHDFNFLLWTLLPKDQDRNAYSAARNIAIVDPTPERKDGGRYIAFCQVDDSLLERRIPYKPQDYIVSGPMSRGRIGSPLYMWMVNTRWSEWREWNRVDYREVELCHAYMSGHLPDVEVNRESYAYLLERGYLVRVANEGDYQFNAVWLDSPDTQDWVFQAIPDLSKPYESAVLNLYDELLELYMHKQTELLRTQIAYQVKVHTCSGRTLAYVLKHLVDAGKLWEPMPHQRSTLSTWMGAVKG